MIHGRPPEPGSDLPRVPSACQYYGAQRLRFTGFRPTISTGGPIRSKLQGVSDDARDVVHVHC